MKAAWAIWIAAASSTSLCAAPVRNGPVVAELISETRTVAPGRPFTIAFRMSLDAPWHAYWINPGDSGLPPSLAWSLPEGFAVGPLQFPFPRAIATPPFMTYGLEGDVWLLATVTPPNEWAADTVTLAAGAEWLICDESCVPGSATLSLTLPVPGGPAEIDPELAAGFAAARERLPIEPSGWRFRALRANGRYLLEATPPDDFAGDMPTATFFPFAADVIRHNAAQVWRRGGNAYLLELVPADSSAPPPDVLSGILVSPGAWGPGQPNHALRADAPFSEESPRLANPERNPP